MARRDRRLLIVEADMATRFTLSSLFRSGGWEVVQAKTAAEALESLDPPPDWLILDTWLPDGDGEAVLRAVRDAGLECRVGVISDCRDRVRCLRLLSLSPDFLVPKPLNFQLIYSVCESDGAPRSHAARPESEVLALEG